MKSLLLFLAGVLMTLAFEATFVGGWLYGAPKEIPAVQTVEVERKHVFKIMAPKGYEDIQYVAFDCKPNIKKTVIGAKLNGAR